MTALFYSPSRMREGAGGWARVILQRNARGVQAECVKLNGAMELAPTLGLAPRIVDLVSSGRTLKENGLVEVERIMDVTSRLVVNRAAMKTRARVVPLVEAFRRAVEQEQAA